jgi:nitrite reductase/ring-hydroxylating ferredoxin subunit
MTPLSSDSSTHRSPDDACQGCDVRDSRRQFLRDAALAVAGIAVALGLPSRAHGLDMSFGAAVRVRGAKASYALPTADGATIDKEREVILVRWQGAVYAFALSCPHQRTMLKWKEDDGGRFQCPKHKSKYRPDGTFISGRATRGMDRYALQRSAGEVTVDLAKLHKEDEDKAAWDAAVVRL